MICPGAGFVGIEPIGHHGEAMLSVHFNYAANHVSRNIATTMRSQNSVMEKLSSGYKINKGADSPADLIMSEQLRSQIDGLERAIRNTTESDNILGIMEGALGQVQGVLTKMRQLAIESANTGIISPDRIAANQAEVDSGLQAIDRILGTTSYGGRKLLDNMRLNGKIGDDYSSILEAGKLLQKNNGKLPSQVYNRDGSSDKLYILDTDQEHAKQLSADGKTLNGEKTFLIPGEDGETTELKFAEGTSLDDILAALRKHTAAPEEVLDGEPPEGGANALTLMGTLFARRGSDINTVELGENQLASLASMSDDDAKSFLANYMQDFAKEIELDLDGWNKLSEADQSMLMTADHLANLSMNSLGGTQVQTGIDKNGNAIYENLTLNDLYGGGKASLSNNPEAAMKILEQAGKDVWSSRAQIGITRKMNEHMRNSMEVTHENLMRMESYIRDTDFAEATVEFARTQVLSQAGMSLLKAAQQQNQFIVDLLA